jgi:hypothetical protein
VEVIDYLGAPVRHWVIVVSLAVFLAIVAVLFPVHRSPMTVWQANAEVGLTPQGAGNSLGAQLDIKQLAYYAQQPAVIDAAAKSLGVTVNSALVGDVVVKKVMGPAKMAAGGTKLDVGVLQPTKSESAHLTRAFTTALGQYVTARLVAQHQTQLTRADDRVTNLANAITALRQSPLPNVVTTTTTTPTSATPTTAVTGTSTTTSTTLKATTTTTAKATTTTTKAKDPPATTTTTSSSSTIATTTTTAIKPAVSPKAIRKREILDLADAYATAVSKQQALIAAGVPPSRYVVIQPAKAKTALAVPGGGTSLLAHRWVRFLLGVLIGTIAGVLISYLVEAFDRRLRTEARATEAFGLPVIVKIPGIAPALRPSREPAIPVVDVVVAPQSATAEAYRRLHVAIRTAPLVSWVRRHGSLLDAGSQGDPYAPRAQLAGPLAAGEGNGAAGASGVEAAGNGLLPDRVPSGRTAILIASPRDEPTRSLTVANLAAVFAEAGQRVLVVTMGGLRSGSVLDGQSSFSPGDLGPDPDPDLIIASSRPSQLPGVSSLPLGQILENPSRLLSKAAALVRAAREVVDVVLFEASLLSTQDAEALLPFVDVVVVVGEFWYTKVGDARDSGWLLSRHRAPVLGLALTNDAPAGLAGLGFGSGGRSDLPTDPGWRRTSPSREPVGAYGRPPQR